MWQVLKDRFDNATENVDSSSKTSSSLDLNSLVNQVMEDVPLTKENFIRKTGFLFEQITHQATVLYRKRLYILSVMLGLLFVIVFDMDMFEISRRLAHQVITSASIFETISVSDLAVENLETKQAYQQLLICVFNF